MSQKSNIPEIVDEEVITRPIEECLSPRVLEALKDISPEIKSLPLVELEDRLSITPTLRRLKISFWDEYRKTISQDLKFISPTSVCAEICSTVFWDVYVVRREEVLAWLFHPPTSFDKKAEEALDYGIDRLREEILKAPLWTEDRNGKMKFDVANASVVLSAVKFLDARVKGSPLQRIEQKSLHLHKNADGPRGISREELDKELEVIRTRLSGSTPLQITAPDETE
jgi:hypothetical protein